MYRKAYVLALEAIIAILIILLFTYIVLPRDIAPAQESDEVALLQTAILTELEHNATFREHIVTNDMSNINNEIKPFIQKTLDLVGVYDFELTVEDVAGPFMVPSSLPEDRDVFAKGIFVTATLQQNSPKLVTLYFWERI